MYGFTLWIHSLLRWAVLILLSVAAFQAFTAWRNDKPWTENHKKFNLFTLIAVDLQLLVGFILYLGVSPTMRSALKSMKTTMKNTELRFWAVEHLSLMLGAIVLVHIGYARAKRGEDDKARHKAAFVFFGIALILILAAIPWPVGRVVRPLFRLTP